MRLRHLATVVSIGVAATVAAPLAAYADTTPAPTPTDAATSSDAQSCPSLPSYVEGRPAHLHPLATTGDYLWHDGTGWHLRVTHPTRQRMVFRGVITASAPISFRAVRDEKRDKVTLSADKRTLVFRFVNYGGIDGVDFTDSCSATTKFALALDGHRLGRNHIFIGAHSARPPHDPFVISRVASATAA